MLKVLVTGHPNSGTSFLCNLLVELRFSPGRDNNLKSADTHNRFGYYENLRLRNYLWESLSVNSLKIWDPGALEAKQAEIAHFDKESIKHTVIKLAQEEGVEVYKDNLLPLFYDLFSPTIKIIAVERSVEDLFASPEKAGQSPIGVPFETFVQTYQAYLSLCEGMQKERDVLWVHYDRFKHDFENEVQRIAEFMEVKEAPDLQYVFRPRYPEQYTYCQSSTKWGRPAQQTLRWLRKWIP